jgi:RNA polymerase sigma-70 factor (ECF subfamily)
MSIREESLIISDILDGDPDAYAILVKHYQKPIFNLMIRMTSSEEDAFDLTQETFVHAYEKLDRFRLSSRFFPWLYTIGMNLARDFLRKKKTAGMGTEKLYESQRSFSTDSEQENMLVEKLDAQQVKTALQKLPLDYREAVMLRFHEGMSIRDVALALGISVSGAKMRIHRGLLKLRKLIVREESNAS